jgi:RNA polymerase sigma factor (sigma-70 family)
VSSPSGVEDRLRALAPQVLGVLVRRHGQFDACEDAVQEALIAAAAQWPADGVPDNPRAWLLTVAGRRLTDAWRSDSARRAREQGALAAEPDHARVAPAADAALDAGDGPPDEDDTLTLLLHCCHPELSAPSQIALTLRAVGGLSTAEIASAFLVPEATMAQRISRAKARIRATGTSFAIDGERERAARLPTVLHVLYLIFNEGYTASSGRASSR